MNNPFNADHFIKDEIEKIIQKYKIKTVFETGTFHGNTTKYFSEMVDFVFTVEINKSYYDISLSNLTNLKNVKQYLGDSAQILKNNIKGCAQPILFYLDAHWYEHNPLLDELDAIKFNNIDKCVIAIHDFKVPGKDFGFDTYNGKDYDINLIENKLIDIYGKGNFSYYYNKEASGSNRGIIYIVPLF